MKAFIFHGAYGNPSENWFPWLKKELELRGVKVFVPKFPTPENQTLDHWLEVIKDYRSEIGEDTILIGHSMACGFILNLLERFVVPIKACFLVAGWVGKLNLELDEINKTFVEKDFDWKKIKSNCKKFFLFNSDDDPYVPLKLGEKLSDHLKGEFNLVKEAGHFNKKAGYLEFSLLLEKIIKTLN